MSFGKLNLRYSTLWLKFKRFDPSSRPGIYGNMTYMFCAFCSLSIIWKSQMASTQRTESQTERGRKWRWESETLWSPGPGGAGVRCLHAWLGTRPGQPGGRGGVFELFIFIIIASPSIYNNYHLRPSLWFGRHMGLGVCWSVIIGNVVISHLQCSHLAQSLFWPGLMWLLRVDWGQARTIVVTLLIGHWALDNTGQRAGRVNFDSVHCSLLSSQWAQNTNTEIISHSQAEPGSNICYPCSQAHLESSVTMTGVY